MRILIEFPYSTHWKTRDKFVKDFDLFYTKLASGFPDRFGAVYEILPTTVAGLSNTPSVLNFICNIKDYFNFVDVWELEKPDSNDLFAKNNFIDFILVPKSVMHDHYSNTLDHS